MPGYYKISHSWVYGRRHPNDDVLLEAVITSYADINVSETLVRWLKDKPKGTTAVDYENTVCWYCGGVWLHYITNTNTLFLYMHSSGEDAFDSLEYYANKIEKVFYKNHSDIDIQWIEHPHKRSKLKETVQNAQI
ncbi:TPA: hypothetical protein JDL67_005299 [Salmonella enterica subsp. salamae]|nr:hypothetical protein [Salmonella enterica subsp. salamae]SQH40560.1 Uncharacterised protein [Salmonella enterica]ECI0412995.1 hypothetical protein [Salmonella enterica subsp. salamae]EDW4021489.1 hypothetical protein [Salmonella enterica subsp. salamae]HAU3358649.1 hypothetical protein [Salmonella enterica subsp. salamae]